MGRDQPKRQTASAFRRALLAWYDANHRELPWRESVGFYRVWLSEVMLQQTRVEAAIPYFHRFLDRFPDVQSLADAPEAEVLAAWSGLGYYSRARNLHRAAKLIAERGVPANHADVLSLPGAGPYTAAAISSIALGLPHAAVDGNVLRVVSRLTNDASEIRAPRTRSRFAEEAQRLLHPSRPGDFNQAMMELGATICVPRSPRCPECPVLRFCAGRAAGRERELPVRQRAPAVGDIELELVALTKNEELLLIRRDDSEKRLAGFWELPKKNLFKKVSGNAAAAFTHRIVNDRFRVAVWRSVCPPSPVPDGGRWFGPAEMLSVPVTTVTRKAIAALRRSDTAEIRSRAGKKTVLKSDAHTALNF